MARTYSSANNPSVPNRWVIAIAAVFLQLALGAVYAWSVFLKPVQDLYHVSKPEANLTFTITLIALGITASFGGYFQSRFGPRTIATVGGILYGVGVFLSGFMPSLFLLYFTYGIIGGIGLGLGYIVPLAMLIKWFPDRRGFITGLAVAGFGAGAAFTGPLATELIKNIGVQTTFIYLGIIYLVITVAAAQFFRPAPANYAPPGWAPSPTQQATSANRDYTFGEALRNPKWYILWLILALNVTAGAALISVASPLAQDFAKIDATTASVIVITISIFNGVGRLFWAWLSDSIGRPFTFLAIFLVQVIVFPILANSSAFPLILVLAAIIGLCYGGGFGTMPAFAADFFGPKNVGMIYGAMLTAWSAGAIVGPILISVADYRTALYIIAGIVLVSAVLPLITRMMINREKEGLTTGTGPGPRGEPA